MRLILWGLTGAGACVGIAALLFAIFGGATTVQMGAMACVGIAFGFLPYLIARSWDEIARGPR